ALSKLVTEQNALGLNQIYIYIQVLILRKLSFFPLMLWLLIQYKLLILLTL
ncbi:hypothetical protein HN51_052536, partial [Arachis hypogaea]